MPYKNKECRQAYNKQYRKEHKEYFKKWRKDNPEKIAAHGKRWHQANPEYTKQYDQIHKSQRNERLRKRRRTDLKFNLNGKISAVMGRALKGNKNGIHWESLIGYTVNNLLKHLKKTMPKGYTWDDYIKGKLQIDHIIPISVFNYNNANNIDFKRCWALSNLRLLPTKENNIKSNKLNKPFQASLKLEVCNAR